MPRRQIYLAVFSNGSKPAHWSIFVQGSGSGIKGTLIHVTGNPATGFFLQFKRNYNFAYTRTPHLIIPLADVDSSLIRESSENGEVTVDTTARDQLEMRATTVRPPGRSANPFDPAVIALNILRERMLTAHQALNCQNWIMDYVDELINSRIVNQTARQALANAPRLL